MESILELRNLVKLFPNQRAVDGISLKIPRGGFYSLLGPSGCGKTTTLRLIAGFEQPTSGEVLLDGAVVNEQRPYQRNVSTVFQNYALFPHLTAAENIAFGLKRKHQSGIEQKVREALELVRLTGKESRYPAQLSGAALVQVGGALPGLRNSVILVVTAPNCFVSHSQIVRTSQPAVRSLFSFSPSRC
jgi:spermidine/putrescine transport system ATP-binding protein